VPWIWWWSKALNKKLTAYGTAAGLAFTVSACAVLPNRSEVSLQAGDSPDTLASEAQYAMNGRASLTMTVRWPSRNTQAIPPSAIRVEASVTDKAGNLLGAGSVTRDGAPSATLAINDLVVPVTGEAVIKVRAIDSLNEEVGVGTKTIVLIPNQRVPVTLAVTATKVPGFTFVSPLAAGPGNVVRVTGANLPRSTDGVALSIGGAAVSILNTDTSAGTYLEFLVPASATSDAIVMNYLGQSIKSTDIFHTVKGIVLEVPASGIASGSKATFVAKALNSASEPVSGARLTWNMVDVKGVPGSSSGGGGGAAGGGGLAPGGGGAGSLDSNFVGSFVDFQTTTAISGSGAAAGGGAPGGGSGGAATPPQATNSITFTTAGTATVEVKTGQTVATATIVIGP